MGYRLNRLDESVFMAGPKPMQTEFAIHHRLESCVKDNGMKALQPADDFLAGSGSIGTP